MAKTAKLSSILNDPQSFRRNLLENQFVFWSRFGVTQSGGSRYESGRDIPGPLRLLLTAYDAGLIDDKSLAALRKRAGLPALSPTTPATPPIKQRRRRRLSGV